MPVIYYLPPGSWSRRPRGRQLTKVANIIAAPFPWNKENLAGGEARVEWVGHPAAETVSPTMSREEAFRHYHLDPDRAVFALAPGSRKQELQSLLPVLAQAGLRLQRQFPGAQFLIPVASSARVEAVRAVLQETGLAATLLAGMEYDALQLAQAAAVCSGTATLEFACLRTPMIVVYKPTRFVEWQFRLRSKRTGLVQVGMPNILAGREVVQELLTEACTPEAVAAALARFLTDEGAREQIVPRPRRGVRSPRRSRGVGPDGGVGVGSYQEAARDAIEFFGSSPVSGASSAHARLSTIPHTGPLPRG